MSKCCRVLIREIAWKELLCLLCTEEMVRGQGQRQGNQLGTITIMQVRKDYEVWTQMVAMKTDRNGKILDIFSFLKLLGFTASFDMRCERNRGAVNESWA